jgi:hypothetical protein
MGAKLDSDSNERIDKEIILKRNARKKMRNMIKTIGKWRKLCRQQLNIIHSLRTVLQEVGASEETAKQTGETRHAHKTWVRKSRGKGEGKRPAGKAPGKIHSGGLAPGKQAS